MKDYIQTAVIFVLFMAFIPCLAFAADRTELDKLKKSSASAGDISVGIYFTEEKKCENYSLEDYIIGAVFAQMPADFDEEALKAQAVLARTYILRRSMSEAENPTAALHGALISDDTSLYQGFFTEEKAKDFYGEEYESAYKKISGAVKAADGILTYEDEPVIAAFHAVSSGWTESAKTAWGQDIPYLTSVESKWDSELEGAQTKVTLSEDEFEKTASETFGIKFDTSPKKWIEIKSADKHGYVTKLSLCGQDISVSDFISAFEISSPCFEYEYSDGSFVFTSQGFGHLVGMSQYGANSMAEEGKNYKDILLYYYKGCEISEY